MKKRKSIKRTPLVIGLIVLIIVVILSVLFATGQSTKRLTDQEKCENSGGKWSSAANSAGIVLSVCVCLPVCDDYYYPDFDNMREVQEVESGLIQTDTKKCGKEVLIDGECVACKTDTDCGEIRTSMSRQYRMEYVPFCTEGLCYERRNIYL